MLNIHVKVCEIIKKNETMTMSIEKIFYTRAWLNSGGSSLEI